MKGVSAQLSTIQKTGTNHGQYEATCERGLFLTVSRIHVTVSSDGNGGPLYFSSTTLPINLNLFTSNQILTFVVNCLSHFQW